MSKLNIIGGIACLAGLLMLGFQAISTLMDPTATDIKNPQTEWESIALVDLLDESYFEWIDGLTYGAAAADTLVTTPLFILFFALGALCFVVNFFMPKV